MKFNAGDIVLCVDDDGGQLTHLNAHKLYHVERSNDEYVYLKGVPGGWMHSRFNRLAGELLKKGETVSEEFRAGDKVKLVDLTDCGIVPGSITVQWEENAIYTIKMIRSGHLIIEELGGSFGLRPSRFVKVQEPVAPMKEKSKIDFSAITAGIVTGR